MTRNVESFAVSCGWLSTVNCSCQPRTPGCPAGCPQGNAGRGGSTKRLAVVRRRAPGSDLDFLIRSVKFRKSRSDPDQGRLAIALRLGRRRATVDPKDC